MTDLVTNVAAVFGWPAGWEDWELDELVDLHTRALEHAEAMRKR